MDTVLANLHQEVLVKAQAVLLIENKSWPAYVRGSFAEMRKAVNDVVKREQKINKGISDIMVASKDGMLS